VNLERPMAADGRFGGHLVQGHVDATGSIEALDKDGEFYWLTVGFPSELAPYFIAKGSVAVDGISLTIADLQQDRFKIQIIPHTWQHTNLQGARPGTRVNLECDLVGKYVMRAIEVRTQGS
jgi:riboflavin synthase